MNKLKVLALCLSASFALVGCNSNEADNTEIITIENPVVDEELLDETNPVSEISSDSEFVTIANVSIDTEKVPGNIKDKSIIDEEVCQIIFDYPYNDDTVECVFRAKVMEAYEENMQGIFDDIESSEHFGFGLGEEIIDVVEVKYTNLDVIVYEFLVEDEADDKMIQCSLELERPIDDDSLSELMENVLWAMNAF